MSNCTPSLAGNLQNEGLNAGFRGQGLVPGALGSILHHQRVNEMEIRLCPFCNKAFYSDREKEFITCPHCDYRFLDRRAADRVKKDSECIFRTNARRRQAKLKDYSETGIRMRYKGRPIKPDTVIGVEIDELNITGSAKAVWSRKEPGKASSSGLMFNRSRKK